MKVLLALLVLAILGVLLWVNISNGNSDSIKSGELQYSEELGWINWGHAKPDGPKEAFDKLLRSNSENTDSFELDYCQRMKAKLAGKWREAKYCETLKLPPSLSRKEAKSAFFDLFIEVSNGFENLQGSFPYSASVDSRNSSFREGDLTGNLIAFYCATQGIDTDAVKSRLTLYSVEESLKKFEKDGLSKEEFTMDSVIEKRKRITTLLNPSKKIK